MMKINRIKWLSVLFTIHCSLFVSMMLTSCDKFLDITPTGKVIATTGEEYRALLTNEYKYFPEDRYMTTVRTDEIQLTLKTGSTDINHYWDLWIWNDENPSPNRSYFSWRTYYHNIYIANYIIEHQNEITEAKASDISQLVGEAYMMRAYDLFLLVNLYAEPYTHCTPATTRGVPMLLEADVNAIPRSSSVEAIYQQVLSDLTEAEQRMNVCKWDEGQNYRFNTVSVLALRARTYLYMGRWTEALKAAQDVIAAHPDMVDLVTGNTLPNNYKSSEIILALEKFSTNMSTVITQPTNDFVNLYRDGDIRKEKFFEEDVDNGNYSLKKIDANSYCSFRSAEAYLIAAEAACQLGNTTDAINLYLMPLWEKRLDATALTAEQTLVNTMSKDELLQEIYDERARELAFEGHRWYDLRRMNPQPTLTHIFVISKTVKRTYTLKPENYTMRFPTEAIESNPEIVQW